MNATAVLEEDFYHDGRGPELQRVIWNVRGTFPLAVEYFNPDDRHDNRNLRHLEVVGVQAYSMAFEEVCGVPPHRSGTRAAISRVEASRWIESLNTKHLAGCAHYQITFYDEIYDIVCREIPAGRGPYPEPDVSPSRAVRALRAPRPQVAVNVREPANAFAEIWVNLDDGQSMCALFNGELGCLMYMREGGDAGLSSRNPDYSGDPDAVIKYWLQNGQEDSYPASWALPASSVWKALEAFERNREPPAWIDWHDDSGDGEVIGNET